MNEVLRTVDTSAESVTSAMEFAWEQGWTDGLPVIPPTPERVMHFLEASSLEPSMEVGNYAVRNRGITADAIAANAVMAGCRPEYLPVVIAAIEAITEPRFKMNHLASTSSPWPAFIVNGPIIDQIGLHSGAYVLGPGHRANATIGRAISLTMANCMDAKVGGVQQGIMGIPSRFAGQVIAEDESTSWESLSVTRGFAATDSTITAVTNFMGGPQQVSVAPQNLPRKNIGLALANMIAEYCSEGSLNTVQLILLSPNLQRAFDNDGWTRESLCSHLVENVRATVASLKQRRSWRQREGEEPMVDSSAPIYPGDDVSFAYPSIHPGHPIWVQKQERLRGQETEYLVAVAGSSVGQMYASLFRPYIPDGATTKVIKLGNAR